MSDNKKEENKIKPKKGGKSKTPKVQNAKLRNANYRNANHRNTNLRLIKNGDLPVEKEEEPLKPAEQQSAAAEEPKAVQKASVSEKEDKPKAVKKTTKKKKSKKKKKAKKSSKSKGMERKSFKKDNIYLDKPEIGEWFVQNRSLVIIAAMVAAVVLSLAGGIYYILTHYKVTTIYVDGNIHYSSEEVMNMVMTGRYGDNSLYLAMKYRDKGVEGIPFVEKMDINILSPDTIRISVYEKALAGYVEYLGRYMYFDKDGIIVESSDITTSGIPQVTGLDFNYVILGEPLPVENEEIFKNILSITQLLNKYNLSADKIFFDSTYDLTLYFEKIKVTLGSSENLDEKIMKIQYILPKLEGKSGTLPMNNYTEETKIIPFNPD